MRTMTIVTLAVVITLTLAFACNYSLQGVSGVSVSVSRDKISCRNVDEVPLTKKLNAGANYKLLAADGHAIGRIRITSVNEVSATGRLITRY